MIEYNPGIDFHWGWLLIALIAVGMVIAGQLRRMDKMKDISITLWTTDEIEDSELQETLGLVLDEMKDVEQYEIVIEEVEPS